MAETKEAEKAAREVIMSLPLKTSANAFDVAGKMEGGKNRFNINTAESMIRRMNGTVREDGRTWVFSPSGGVHGSWLMRKAQ